MEELNSNWKSRSEKSQESGLIGKAIETAVQKLRRKPGPQKKDNSRSEKISCRLSKEERALGLAYCKKHGIIEAKLLRASYLSAIAEIPSDRLLKLVDTLVPTDDLNLTLDQKAVIRSRVKDTLRKSATVLLLILMGCTAASYVVKYVWNGYDPLYMYRGEKCISTPGQIGCSVVKPE